MWVVSINSMQTWVDVLKRMIGSEYLTILFVSNLVKKLNLGPNNVVPILNKKTMYSQLDDQINSVWTFGIAISLTKMYSLKTHCFIDQWFSDFAEILA